MMKPEVQHIAITRVDGSLAVMQFITKGMRRGDVVFQREATDDAIAAEIAKTGIDAKTWRRVDHAEIPTDRTFREAWKDAGRIDVDMPRAREIHRERLRDLRAPLLAALDVEYQRADEAGDAAEKARVAAKKQALRDVTSDPIIEAAKTPVELKSAIPAALRASAPTKSAIRA